MLIVDSVAREFARATLLHCNERKAAFSVVNTSTRETDPGTVCEKIQNFI